MTESIELELTYLVKYLPKGLEGCKSLEVSDIYIPKSEAHPNLRVRKNGDKFMMTKKTPIGADLSEQMENTIPLTPKEFESLSKLEGKRLRKIRYLYGYGRYTAEIGVFKDGLEGLVLADFEFASREEKNSFAMPDFCLADVTDEEFLTGGMLCGKNYSEIEGQLMRFDYKKISAGKA